MITALAPLGAKYKLQFVPEYSEDGTVTVAIIYSLRHEKEPAPRSLTFSGTPAEVDAALVTQLPAAVERLARHATTLEELDRQLAAEVAEKKAATEKKKPTPAPQVKHSPPVAKKDKAIHATETKTEVEVAEAPPPDPAALQPAWRKLKPAEAAEPASTVAGAAPLEQLGNLFTEPGAGAKE